MFVIDVFLQAIAVIVDVSTFVGARYIGVNLSSNAYSTDVLPPLIPPWKGGKKNLVPSPLQLRCTHKS